MTMCLALLASLQVLFVCLFSNGKPRLDWGREEEEVDENFPTTCPTPLTWEHPPPRAHDRRQRCGVNRKHDMAYAKIILRHWFTKIVQKTGYCIQVFGLPKSLACPGH